MEYNQNYAKEYLEYRLNSLDKQKYDNLIFALNILNEKNYSIVDLGEVYPDGIKVNNKKILFSEINNLERKIE